MKDIKELRRVARELKPIINIGKSGLTDPLVIHIKNILSKKKLQSVQNITQ